MKTFAPLLACLSLCGCASMSPAQTEALKIGLQHIEGCDRTYTGGTGIGAAFTFNINCRAIRPEPAPVDPTP